MPRLKTGFVRINIFFWKPVFLRDKLGYQIGVLLSVFVNGLSKICRTDMG